MVLQTANDPKYLTRNKSQTKSRLLCYIPSVQFTYQLLFYGPLWPTLVLK